MPLDKLFGRAMICTTLVAGSLLTALFGSASYADKVRDRWTATHASPSV